MENLKKSAQWIKESEYSHLQILDYYAWEREGQKRFNYHWFNEDIGRKEFEIRLSYSAVRDTATSTNSWYNPWNSVMILENGNEVRARTT